MIQGLKLLIVPLLFLFAGCSTTAPAISEYRINANLKAKEFSQTGCKDNSLKIAQAFSSSDLMIQSMSYGEGDFKQFQFSESQWADSPNRAITSEILSYIKKTKLFKNVQTSKSRSKNRFLLEINIEDFMQYFSEDTKNSYVKVVIALTLIDTKTNDVLSTETFTKRVEVENINAEGGVKSLNKALNDVIAESGEWLGRVCSDR